MTCGAAPTWRHSSAAGRGLKVGTHGLQVPPPHPGAVGSSIGGAGRTRNRPGCCLDPECPDLKKEWKNILPFLKSKLLLNIIVITNIEMFFIAILVKVP